MHGKPKCEKDFAEGKSEPVKEVWYYYKTRSGQYTLHRKEVFSQMQVTR